MEDTQMTADEKTRRVAEEYLEVLLEEYAG